MSLSTLSGILGLALALPAQVTTSGATGFVDFSARLAEPGAAVAIVRLGKINLGKRERLKDAEAELGGLGQSMQVFGTVFYRVAASAKAEVAQVLHGQSPKGPLAFELQQAALPTGKQMLRFRTPGRAPAEEGKPLLVVLHPDKKGLQIVEAVAARSEDKGIDAERAFEATARDLYAVNRRIRELRQALDDAAKRAEVKDVDGAVALLDKALAGKVELREPTHESWLQMHAAPLERAAKQKREELAAAKNAPADKKPDGDAGRG